MSKLKVDAISHNAATSDAITMASDGTCTARITGMTGGGGGGNASTGYSGGNHSGGSGIVIVAYTV